MRMYHGNHDTLVLHPGLCLTDNDSAACAYGRPSPVSTGWLHELDLDLDVPGLVIAEADDYDHDENVAPGDYGYDGDADILIFADETDTGRRHDTYRLMTPAALAACSLVTSTPEEY